MADEKQFSIQRIYVKDVSFESPNAPGLFAQKWEPKVEFNLQSNAQKIQDDLYEVAITTTVTVKQSVTVQQQDNSEKQTDNTAYLAEVCQAGVFLLKGFEEKEMGPMLGSFCPNVLFPYAREAVSDLVTRGGFPPMLLSPVNFDAVYAQHMQNVQNQAQENNTLN